MALLKGTLWDVIAYLEKIMTLGSIEPSPLMASLISGIRRSHLQKEEAHLKIEGF